MTGSIDIVSRRLIAFGAPAAALATQVATEADDLEGMTIPKGAFGQVRGSTEVAHAVPQFVDQNSDSLSEEGQGIGFYSETVEHAGHAYRGLDHANAGQVKGVTSLLASSGSSGFGTYGINTQFRF
ncbi:MAG: hypothetical protein ACRC35_06980 [Angustibacter sp.]